MMSASDFIGALAGSRQVRVEVALELRRSGSRRSSAAGLGVGICTVVAPSAWIAAIAAWYCALVLLMTPIRLPGQRGRGEPGEVVRDRGRRVSRWRGPRRPCRRSPAARRPRRRRSWSSARRCPARPRSAGCRCATRARPSGRRPTRPCCGGRADDRARGLGADRDRARGPRRPAAPEPRRRAARAEVDVVRVEHLAAERRVAVRHAVGHEVRELGQVRLAEDHGAGRAQLGHDRRVTRPGSSSGAPRCRPWSAGRRRRGCPSPAPGCRAAGRARGRWRARGRAARRPTARAGSTMRTAFKPGPRALVAAIRLM